MSQKHKNNEISVPFRLLLLIMVILAALIAGTEPWDRGGKQASSSELLQTEQSTEASAKYDQIDTNVTSDMTEPLLAGQVGRMPSEVVQIDTNEVPVSTGPVKVSFRISPKFSDEQPAIPASVTKNSVDQEE